MRTFLKVSIVGWGLVCLTAAMGSAQQTTSAPDTSLGDIARQLRAQRAKEAKAPVKVITNDDIVIMDEKSGFGASTELKAPTNAPAAGESGAHDKAYFQSHMAALQSKLDTHQRELDVLQQKLGQNQTQYYPNPQDSLMQQYTRTDIDKLTADIDAKKQQIADDQKAMDDLREQLRREGGDPGWLR